MGARWSCRADYRAGGGIVSQTPTKPCDPETCADLLYCQLKLYEMQTMAATARFKANFKRNPKAVTIIAYDESSPLP